MAAETLPGQWRGHWFEDGRQTPQTFAASLELVAGRGLHLSTFRLKVTRSAFCGIGGIGVVYGVFRGCQGV